jgi:hypothetical protein
LRADRGVGQGGQVGMAVTLGLLAYTGCYTTGGRDEMRETYVWEPSW